MSNAFSQAYFLDPMSRMQENLNIQTYSQYFNKSVTLSKKKSLQLQLDSPTKEV